MHSLILMDTSGWSFANEDADIAAMIAGFIESFDPAGGLPDLGAMPSPETDLIAAATPPDWQAMKEEMAAAFDPYTLKALGRQLFEGDGDWVRPRLGEISCPVTVIVGEHDHPFIDQAADLAAEVADGRAIVIDGAYHSPQLTHRARVDRRSSGPPRSLINDGASSAREVRCHRGCAAIRTRTASH